MNTLHAKYAVFLPVRNGAKYLADAINSVHQQNREDWILLVLDNASTDGSAEIALACNHPRIYVLKSTKELTIVESWHRVWVLLKNSAVRCEFLTIIGHDDLLEPSFLCAIEALHRAYPNASLYQTLFTLIDNRGRLIRPCKAIPTKETSSDFLASRGWGLRDSFGVGHVFRSTDYLAVGGMPRLPNLIYADDLLFARLAQAGGKVCSDVVACHCRVHRGSASGGFALRNIICAVKALSLFLNYLKNEFPAYCNSARGKAATACLIAREALVFESVLFRWSLPQEASDALNTLVGLYEECASGTSPRQLIGTNFVNRDIYLLTKRMQMLHAVLHAKLTPKWPERYPLPVS